MRSFRYSTLRRLRLSRCSRDRTRPRRTKKDQPAVVVVLGDKFQDVKGLFPVESQFPPSAGPRRNGCWPRISRRTRSSSATLFA